MAISEADLRDQIFALRGQTPPVSFQKIADQLSVSKGIVYRLFHQPAKATAESNGNVILAAPRAGDAEEDPELAAAARRLERKKLELQEHELDRRLALLDGKAGGGDSAMGSVIALLSEQMRRMEENVDRRLAIAQPKAAEDPMSAMVNGMGMLTKIQQQAALLAPPPPVPAAISPEHVELRVLLEKMNIETEGLRQRASAEAERSAFVFGMLKENAPMIIAGVQKWIENQGQRNQAPAMPTLQVLSGGRSEVIQAGPVEEIPMACGQCNSRFMVRPEPGELPKCTVCGGVLQPEAGPPPPPKNAWPEDAIVG